MLSKLTYNVVASGSTGNCEIAREVVMIDCGLPYSQIKKHSKTLKLVILTHIHQDHFNIRTIKKLSYERPTLRFAIGEHLKDHMEGVRNVDVLDLNEWYDYGEFKVSLGKLYHDVPNVFIRLNFGGYKMLRATDTGHLQGIKAKGYDLYALEANYDEDTVWDNIKTVEARGEFSHQRGSINTHLSYQQARDFYFENKAKEAHFIRLHESSNY